MPSLTCGLPVFGSRTGHNGTPKKEGKVHAHPIDGLTLNEANPRRIRPERLEDLKRALVEDPDMLWARPVIALPDGTVIAGNMRVQAAKALGWTEIPTIVVELHEQRARLWMLRDNAAYGEWKDGEVGDLLAELVGRGTDLALTGFASDELDRLLAVAKAGETGLWDAKNPITLLMPHVHTCMRPPRRSLRAMALR